MPGHQSAALPDAISLAQSGVYLIKQAILSVLAENRQGMGNAELADALNLRSSVKDGSRNYLTFSVLGLLESEGLVKQDDESKWKLTSSD